MHCCVRISVYIYKAELMCSFSPDQRKITVAEHRYSDFRIASNVEYFWINFPQMEIFSSSTRIIDSEAVIKLWRWTCNLFTTIKSAIWYFVWNQSKHLKNRVTNNLGMETVTGITRSRKPGPLWSPWKILAMATACCMEVSAKAYAATLAVVTAQEAAVWLIQ